VTVRRLRVWHFLLLTAVYIAIVQGVALLLRTGQDGGYAEPTSVDYLVRSYVVPVGLAVVFALAVTAWLGSWQRIFVERRRFRRWTVVVPIILFGTVAVVTNYSGSGSGSGRRRSSARRTARTSSPPARPRWCRSC
jgi:uncharacterized protein